MERAISLIVVIIGLSGCPFLPGDGEIRVAGRVQNSAGEPIPGATIETKCSDHLAGQFTGATDRFGCFSLGALVAPGNYDCTVTVAAEGYAPLSFGAPTLSDNLNRYILSSLESHGQSEAAPMTKEDIILDCPTLIPGWTPES